MPRDFVATVNDPARAAYFVSALGEGVEVYLTSIRPAWALMGGEEELLYFVDLEQYTEAQRESLYRGLCELHDYSPDDSENRATYEELGIPLRADGVVVTIHNALRYAGHPDPNMNPFRFWAMLGQGDEDDDDPDDEDTWEGALEHDFLPDEYEDYEDGYERDEPERDYPDWEDIP